MAGQGPPPKKGAIRRQGRRGPIRRAEVVELPVATPDPPAPRSTWLAPIRRDWEAFWGGKLAPLLTDDDVPALRRLYDLRDERDRIRRVARGQYLVAGSKGQHALNPLLRQAQALDAEIRMLEDRFGLNPMARLRLGISLGQATRTLEDLWESFDSMPAHDAPDPRLHVVMDSDPAKGKDEPDA